MPNQARGREVSSSLFTFKDNLTMVSWHPKRSNFVLLMSPLQHNSNIAESGKIEIVEFYNKTKAGVDGLNQKSSPLHHIPKDAPLAFSSSL